LLVFLRGAYDAVNVVAPARNAFYHEARPTLALAAPDPANPQAALPLDESALKTMQSRKTAPRVAFGALVEAGWIRPGAELIDRKARYRATVRADGSIEAGAAPGSIHGIGAAVQGAPSCNGWTFWHVEHEGAVKPLDALRQLYLLATED
jgi:modification methylase